LRKWIGIALGVAIGLGTIYLPLLVQQARVPNLMVSGTRDDGQASARSEGVEEDVVQWERLPILVAIIGLGVGVAFTTYRLVKGRQV